MIEIMYWYDIDCFDDNIYVVCDAPLKQNKSCAIPQAQNNQSDNNDTMVKDLNLINVTSIYQREIKIN